MNYNINIRLDMQLIKKAQHGAQTLTADELLLISTEHGYIGLKRLCASEILRKHSAKISELENKLLRCQVVQL